MEPKLPMHEGHVGLLNTFLEEFAPPPVPLKWFRGNGETPSKGWTAPDWTVRVGLHTYLVHTKMLGHGERSSNFFSVSMTQFSGKETDLTNLLPPSCHAHWETVLNFMYRQSSALTDQKGLSVDNVVSLLTIAHTLRISAVAQRCVKWINTHVNHINAFPLLAAAIDMLPALEPVEQVCLAVIARNMHLCHSLDSFLSLDVSSLKQILDASSALSVKVLTQYHATTVVVHYLRHVANEHRKDVFLHLSKYVHQASEQHALFLYFLSLDCGCKRLHRECLQKMNWNRLNLDDMRFACDKLMEIAVCDFTNDPTKMCRFVVKYWQTCPDVETSFQQLARHVTHVCVQDLPYLYGLSAKFRPHRLFDITLQTLTTSFEKLCVNDNSLLSKISNHGAVCQLLDRQDLMTGSEDQVFDALCRLVDKTRMSPQEQEAVWSTCRFAWLSNEYCQRAAQRKDVPKGLLKLCIAAKKDRQAGNVENTDFMIEKITDFKRKFGPRRWYSMAVLHGPGGAVFVSPGKGFIKIAVAEAKRSALTTLYLEKGVHIVEGDYAKIDCSLTLIGAGKDKTIVRGGFMIKGKKDDHVVMKHMTIRKSKKIGVWGNQGASFYCANVLIGGCEHGVVVNGAHGTLFDCCVENCLWSGIVSDCEGLIDIHGEKTQITGNCTDVRYICYGLHASYSSKIRVHFPLTNNSVSLDNKRGMNWGGCGAIEDVLSGGKRKSSLSLMPSIFAKKGTPTPSTKEVRSSKRGTGYKYKCNNNNKKK